MQLIVEAIATGDVCSLLLLAGIFLFVGAKIVGNDPSLQQWGLRLGAIVFVAFAIFRWLAENALSAEDVITIAVRAAIAAGMATGVCWVLLPFLAKITRSIGTTWRRSRDAWKERRRKAHEQSEAEQRRRWAAEEEVRLAPLRQQQQREADERRKTAAAAQRRREDIRAQCELIFTTFAPEVGSRFPREMFEHFVRTYMGDNRSPDEVEQRAHQLEGILHEHRAAIKPAPRFRNLEELATWYMTETGRIESLPVDELFKEQQLVQLNSMYADLTQSVLEQA